MESLNYIKNTFCRLCLNQEGNLISIFDNNDNSEQNDISKYIGCFFAVEITKTDPYSTYVCKICWDFIVKMCKCRLNFRKNDALLRNNTQLPEAKKSLKIKLKITPRCHDSVKRIFAKYKQLKIPKELWGLNFDAKLKIPKYKIPVINGEDTNTKNSHNKQVSPITIKTRNNVYTLCNTKAKNYSHDPDFYLVTPDYRRKSESDNIADEVTIKRSKRNYKRTTMFGNPLYLPEDDGADDTLNSILQDYSDAEYLPPITNIKSETIEQLNNKMDETT